MDDRIDWWVHRVGAFNTLIVAFPGHPPVWPTAGERWIAEQDVLCPIRARR